MILNTLQLECLYTIYKIKGLHEKYLDILEHTQKGGGEMMRINKCAFGCAPKCTLTYALVCALECTHGCVLVFALGCALGCAIGYALECIL